MGVAQLVEGPTEKPDAILTQVQVPGAAREFSPRVNFHCRLSSGACTAPCVIASVNTGAARDFSPRVNFHCRLSSGACTAPCTAPCVIASVNTVQRGIFPQESTFIADSLLVRVQPHVRLQASTLFGHIQIQHTLVEMGSAALVAAITVPS